MKVHTYGNVLNNAYNFTRFLRWKGVDAEMFLDDTSPAGQNYPWWEHPELGPDNLPEWIHYHRVTKRDVTLDRAPFRAMAREFSNADVSLSCSWGPILAREAKVPAVFYSHGSDVVSAHTMGEGRDAIRRIRAGMRPGVRDLAVGLRQRVALKRHVDVITILMGYQIENYLRPLGLLPKTVRGRLAWDVKAYAGREDPDLIAKCAPYELVYFMISRHSWHSPWSDLKGNDKFIRAFARFVHERRPNVRLFCIDKGIDVQHSRDLIAELGIESYVEWLPEMNKEQLRGWYGVPNLVIVDQFWHDRWAERFPADAARPRIGFGSAGLEAMAAHRPLISVFFDEEFYDGIKPPMLDAFTVDEIHRRLLESVDMGEAGRRALTDRAFDFVMKYHDWTNATDPYIRLLEDVVRAHRDGRPYRPVNPLG